MYKRNVTNFKNSNNSGFTLIEIIVMVAIMSVFFVTISGIFYALSKGTFLSKSKTIANNLAQERIEYLKNYTYYRLLVTPQSDIALYDYDNTYYPSEEMTVGEIRFTRSVTVRKVREIGTGSNRKLEELSETDPDTGLKEIKVTVSWQEGNVTKSLSLSNLREDPDRSPLDGRIYGTITSTGGAAIGNATVYTTEDMNYSATTETDGSYEFAVTSGSYHVKVSKQGYFDSTSGSLTVSPSGDAAYSTQLSQILLGHVTGYVAFNGHPIIVTVVASTIAPNGFAQEYLVLRNPTTSTIFFGNGFNIANFKIKAVSSPPGETVTEVPITSFLYVDPVIPKYGYFLIANTETITLGGVNYRADAVYGGSNHVFPYGADIILDDAGGIILTDSSDNILDKVGWKDRPGGKIPTVSVEGTVLSCGATGFPGDGRKIRRQDYISSSGSGSGTNPAVDTDNNLRDFDEDRVYPADIYNSTSTKTTPVSGFQATGAIVSCNDGYSNAVTAYTYGSYGAAYFDIAVPTGTWTIAITSGNYYMEVSSVVVASGGYKVIPNSRTTPYFSDSYFSYATTILSSGPTNGIITGRVLNTSNAPIPNILVDAGGYQTLTNTSGRFMVGAPVDSFVTANYNYNNTNYTTYVTTYAIPVTLGQMVDIPDIILYSAGQIDGWVRTANRIDPLPGVIMLADGAGDSYTTVSQSGGSPGYFLIRNVRAGTYNVSAQVDTSESSSPTVKVVTVAAGQKVWSSTFSVSSAYGTFSGHVYEDSALIKTGVLIIATTATIAGDPPVINSASMSGATLYYSTLSKDDGTYELSVRASTTTLFNIYGWNTKVTGTGTQTTKRTKAGNGVLPGANIEVNFGPTSANDSW